MKTLERLTHEAATDKLFAAGLITEKEYKLILKRIKWKQLN